MTLPEPVREALDTINAKACAIVDIAEVGQVVDATDTLRDHIATLTAERDDLLNQLGECFRMAGADPDGNENWRLARRALKAVTDLRRDYDENEDWKSRHDALAQRCAAAERGVQAARSLCESWHAEARAEGYGGGNTRAHLILAAIDAAIHQETP